MRYFEKVRDWVIVNLEATEIRRVYRNMRYLYQKLCGNEQSKTFENDFLHSCCIEKMVPKPWKIKRKTETLCFYEYLSRWYFGMITGWRYRIYYLLDKDQIVHTSFVVPRCHKFPFLGKMDYEIGPCVTKEAYRRRGSYCYMLDNITNEAEYGKSMFYMIVKATNEPSVKGIEKAGFCRCGYIKRDGFLKIYKRCDENARES